MTAVRLRTVDAFTDRPFTGNPAAVLVLDETPSDEWMAAVARETNLSDTGFVIREEVPDADFRLRWFTPTVEIDLCGHATLASAHCLFEDGVQGPIRFATRSGVLTVDQRSGGSLAMDFPAWPSTEFDAGSAVEEPLCRACRCLQAQAWSVSNGAATGLRPPGRRSPCPTPLSPRLRDPTSSLVTPSPDGHPDGIAGDADRTLVWELRAG